MPNSSDSTKMVMGVVGLVVLLAVAAVTVVALKGADKPELEINRNAPADSAASTTQNASGTVSGGASATATQATASSGQSKIPTAGAAGTNSGYVTNLNQNPRAGQTMLQQGFRPSRRVAEALGFRRVVQEVDLPPEAREKLQQYEQKNHDELLELLNQRDAALNAAFEEMLASERTASPVTTDKARAELIKKFVEHLEFLEEVNKGYFMEAQRHLDNRGKAALINQFDNYRAQTIEIPYTVAGTNSPAVTLRGTIDQSYLEVVDGGQAFRYMPSADGTTYVPFGQPVE